MFLIISYCRPFKYDILNVISNEAILFSQIILKVWKYFSIVCIEGKASLFI